MNPNERRQCPQGAPGAIGPHMYVPKSKVDKHKLHFGPYSTPPFRYGAKVDCLSRGEVKITGLSDAPIQWPIGSIRGGRSPVLFDSLVDAVRMEAACAVAHWWGVSTKLVRKWRRALGVPTRNEGDHLLMREYAKTDTFKAIYRLGIAKSNNPKRRAKIAAALRGRNRPASVVEALRIANLGKRASKAARRHMSEAQMRRTNRKTAKSWRAWEDDLLRTVTPNEVAKRTGRTLAAVWGRRNKLQLPDLRTKAARQESRAQPSE
jgi:hypothetical protein